MPTWRGACAIALWLCAGAVPRAATPAGAQSTLDRTPNVAGPWIGDGGVVRFHVLHRFNQSGPPARQISSHPTFLLAYAGPGRFAGVLGGVRYATRSEVEAGVPNEWEPFVRMSLLGERDGRPAAAAATVAWNAAAQAVDAELTARLRHGRFTALAAGRVLGITGPSTARPVVAGSVITRLTQHVALGGDVSVATRIAAPAAWGAAVLLAIPYSPHSLSLQVTNTNSGTVRGSSLATPRARYGFEFTVPITLRRYFGTRPTAAEPPVAPSPAHVIRIHNLSYAPDSIVVPRGSTVEWRNADPLPHTATADDGAWDSGEIAPNAVWRRRFDAPGRYTYHCTPHPFMQGVIVVR
jgi:plastocyanin